jgi:C4-dicarboxylate transporter DctQ subunit
MSGHGLDISEAGQGGYSPRPVGPLNRALGILESGLVVFAGFIVIAMMLTVTADVISRTLFNFPLPNSYEYMELGMVFAVYLGVAQVQREKRHVAIDAVIKHFSLRLQAAFELLGCVIGLVLMCAICWWGSLAAWNSYVTSEYVGSVARLPVLPARVALVVGAFVLIVQLMFDVADYARKIIRPDQKVELMEGGI